MLATTLLLAAVLGQSASTIAGAAMGPNNQPVGQALIYISEGPVDDGSVPALGQGMTDAQGRYRLEVGKRAPSRTSRLQQPTVFAYRAGMALSGSALARVGVESDPRAFQLALEPAAKRTLNFADRAGRPLAGLRVTPLQVTPSTQQVPQMAIPDVLAERLAVTTDAKGQAVLDCLAPKYGLQAVRVRLAGGTSHVLDVPVNSIAANPLGFVLDPGGQLAGRVLTEDGKPAAGAVVEVWPDSRPSYFGLWSVRFAGGPIRAGEDGSFRTPPGLLAGERYHVLVKSDSWQQKATPAVVLSADANATTSYPDVVLTPKRALTGRVVDRQGHAVADAVVIANSFVVDDAEILPSTYFVVSNARSQSQGQFRVMGLSPRGGVVLVVRAKGFRIFGRTLSEHETKDIQVVLTRPDETPAPTMTTRPGPLLEAERRKLARQVLQPLLKKALAEGNDQEKVWALEFLMDIDTDAALALADKTTFAARNDDQHDGVRAHELLNLARLEPETVATVARSLKNPYRRGYALLEVSRHLPADRTQRRVELIEQALAAAREVAKADQQIYLLAKSAALLMDCGEQKQAKALASEVRAGLEKVANPAGSSMLAGALTRLGRVDMPAARAILEKQIAEEDRPRILGNIATHIAASDPAEAERLLDAVKTRPSRFSFVVRTCFRMAPVDLPRARRLVRTQIDGPSRAVALVCVASALPASQRAAARELAMEALAELDREEDGQESQGLQLQPILPLLEAIDPALVPEGFWRIFTRPARALPDRLGLARYEPDVAATMFPTELLERMLETRGGNRTARQVFNMIAILELAARDPIRVVQFLRPDSDPPLASLMDAIRARRELVEFLGRPAATRWNYWQSPYGRWDRTLFEDSDLQY